MDFEDIDDFDDSAFLQVADALETQARAPPPPKPRYNYQPFAGPSKPSAYHAAGHAPTTSKAAFPRVPAVREVALVATTKHWDRSVWQREGWKGAGMKKQGKGKARGRFAPEESEDEHYEAYQNDDGDAGDPIGFDAGDPSLDLLAPPPAMTLVPNLEAMKTWVYPLNKPLRDYQYNIAYKALFTNVLCSLPTGLGKTFIAAVVMLNFYRWYASPDGKGGGKIIFMAPTRPLVAQQIEACASIVGIPQSDSVEITGNDSPAAREQAWKTRRVFYATPQTVGNDLQAGRVKASDVVCVVIDEAHRASGNYAYCAVVRYLMTANPHFRVLALTATPGSKPDAVQNVVDNLHIGAIEVRTDQALDIQKYIHRKETQQEIVYASDEMLPIRDAFAKIMGEKMSYLLSKGIIYSKDPLTVSAFAIQSATSKCKGENANMYPACSAVATMARAMQALLELSISAFLQHLKEMQGDSKPGSNSLTNSHNFLDVVRRTEALVRSPGYVPHPKMQRLRDLVKEHFGKNSDPTGGSTRVMVFCSLRAIVDEIVDFLNVEKPLVRATRFVGQSADARGRKGTTQKEQMETIKQFKRGDYNVLVATSIGEEGLDIGEVDLIVCYETSKSPIRMLQRVGRTGRAREGKIIVLMAAGREDKNWDKAKDGYKDVQNAILSGTKFELYADCDRLVPDGHKPAVEKKIIETSAYVKEDLALSVAGFKRRAPTTKKPAKSATRNMPEGAELGFRKASEVRSSGSSKRPDMLAARASAALLSESQRAYLDKNWRRGGVTQRVESVDRTGPLALTATSLAFVIPASDSRKTIQRAIKTGSKLADEAKLEAWKEKHGDAFDRDLVVPWSPYNRGASIGKHRSLRPPPPPPMVIASAKQPRQPVSRIGSAGSSSSRIPTPAPIVASKPKTASYAIDDSDADIDSDADLPDPDRLPSQTRARLAHPTRSAPRPAPMVVDLDPDEDELDSGSDSAITLVPPPPVTVVAPAKRPLDAPAPSPLPKRRPIPVPASHLVTARQPKVKAEIPEGMFAIPDSSDDSDIDRERADDGPLAMAMDDEEVDELRDEPDIPADDVPDSADEYDQLLDDDDVAFGGMIVDPPMPSSAQPHRPPPPPSSDGDKPARAPAPPVGSVKAPIALDLDSDSDIETMPPPPRPASARPPLPPPLKPSYELFDDDIDDEALMAIDEAAMPPPILIPRSRPFSMPRHQPNPLQVNTQTSDDSPVVIRRRLLGGPSRRRPLIQESSQEDTVTDDSIVIVPNPAPARHATLIDDSAELTDEDDGCASSLRRPDKAAQKALRRRYVDDEAVNDDDSNEASDDEEIEPENEEDRHFVANDESMIEADGEDGEQSITSLYLNAMNTQGPASKLFARPPEKAGAYKLGPSRNYGAVDTPDRRRRRYDDSTVDESGMAIDEQSQFSRDSFCVSDNDPLSFDESEAL